MANKPLFKEGEKLYHRESGVEYEIVRLTLFPASPDHKINYELKGINSTWYGTQSELLDKFRTAAKCGFTNMGAAKAPASDPPPTPEESKHMWWDDGRSKGAWCYTDGRATYCWMPKFNCWTAIEEVTEAELVRRVKDSIDLVVENHRLIAALAEPSVLKENLEAILMCRDWHEGNPEGALENAEVLARKALGIIESQEKKRHGKQ